MSIFIPIKKINYAICKLLKFHCEFFYSPEIYSPAFTRSGSKILNTFALTFLKEDLTYFILM